ncbi:hypothetical protein ACFWYW_57085 [Nonomuraea sp. NPDC059023]|uniref:hypothetical protein n=1 Tax=unclassified Nonomuraea TaxID=2593643 RepID=UPI0036C07170
MSPAKRLLSRIRAELGQRGHHRAFRIPAPAWEDELGRLLAAATTNASPPDEKAPDEKALAAAATNLWRAERRLARRDEKPTTATHQAGRYVRATRSLLAEAGLVVQDHDGEPFHSGLALEVMLFQDDPSLTAETILETVRPSIYLMDRHIQMGQVIVGCPLPPSIDRDDDVRNPHA